MNIDEIKTTFLNPRGIFAMDDNQLSTVINNLIEVVWECENECEKRDLLEFLQLLEWAPEFQSRVAVIFDKTQQRFEEQLGNLKEELGRKEYLGEEWQKNIKKMENDLERTVNQYVQQKNEIDEVKKKLEDKIECLKTISNNEKTQLIIHMRNTRQLYNQEKQKNEQLKKQWISGKNKTLVICSRLCQIEMGGPQ